MRVYVIGPIYPYRGGISHSNEILCASLSKKHEVKVISFKRLFPSILYPGGEQKEATARKLELSVEYIIDSINPLTWIKTFLTIKRERPDLLAFQWWTPFFTPSYFIISLLTKLFTKTKISIVCQNVLPHETTFFDIFLTKMVFKNADFFIALSREDVRNVKTILPEAKVEYLMEPTYDRIFNFKIPKAEAKKLLNINGNLIFFFGFVRGYKGLIYLITAMPKVVKELDAALLIAGEFWEDKEQYLKEIEKLGIRENTIIIDRYATNEEAAIYFSAADVVVLPYISSTESGIIQLAFGFNKPVITTNVGGNPDIIEHDKTGLLVPPQDSEALAQAIIYYFKNEKEKEFEEEIKKKRYTFEWDEEKEKIFFHGLPKIFH